MMVVCAGGGAVSSNPASSSTMMMKIYIITHVRNIPAAERFHTYYRNGSCLLYFTAAKVIAYSLHISGTLPHDLASATKSSSGQLVGVTTASYLQNMKIIAL